MTRPLALTGLRRQIYLVQRRDRSLSLAAQSLCDLMLEQRPAEAGRRRRGRLAPSPSGRGRG